METEVALLEDNLSFAGDLVNDKINTLWDRDATIREKDTQLMLNAITIMNMKA
jgi:hypothetical protein